MSAAKPLQHCPTCGRDFKNLNLHLARSACGAGQDSEKDSEQEVERSPLLTKCVWGELETSAGVNGKDLKLFPGGAKPWDWRETGTRHVPGIQPADIQELLDKGAEYVVLSRGFDEVLQTPQSTLDWLAGQGVPYFWAETRVAAAEYNRLAKAGAKVGGLFHSTC